MRRMVLTGLLIASSQAISAAQWQSAGDSEFTFTVQIEGVATSGNFGGFAVTLDFDPTLPEKGELVVRVDLRKADLGDPDMNAVLFDPAWFDVGQFREAVFRSEDIVERSPGEYTASGMLDLKGTMRPVSVPFTWRAVGEAAAMDGQLTLQRTDFDVGSGEWAGDDAIGVDVTLTFAIALVPAG